MELVHLPGPPGAGWNCLTERAAKQLPPPLPPSPTMCFVLLTDGGCRLLCPHLPEKQIRGFNLRRWMTVNKKKARSIEEAHCRAFLPGTLLLWECGE